jgi:hypothetical protein
VTSAPIADAWAAAQLDEVVRQWATQWRDGGVLGEIVHQPTPDDRGQFHWLIRLPGEEKDVIALWVTLRQRTVHLETEVMPAAEENREALYRYLLVKNAELKVFRLAIGPEEGIYLMAEIPAGELSVERLDEFVGASVVYVDEIFPTAMSIGLASLYRRCRPPSAATL